MPSKRSALTQRLITTALGATLFLLTAAITTAVIVHKRLPQYRGVIASQLSQRLDMPVSIGALELRWHGFGPTLRLRDVHIDSHAPEHQANPHQANPRQTSPRVDLPRVDLPRVDLKFAIPDLLQGQYLPAAIVVRQPKFTATVDPSQPSLLDATLDPSQLANMRALLDRISITDGAADITLRTAGGPQHMQLQHLQATLRSNGDQLTLDASGSAGHWLQQLSLQAQLSGPLTAPDQAKLSIDIKHAALLPAWQIATGSTAALSGGTANAHIDSTWQAGSFDQARLRLHTTALRPKDQDKSVLPALDATFTAHAGEQPHTIIAALQSLQAAQPSPTTPPNLAENLAANLAAIEASARFDTQQPGMTLQAQNIALRLLQPLLYATAPGLAQAQLDGTLKQVELSLAASHAPRASMTFAGLRITTPRFAAGPLSGNYHYRRGHNKLQFTHAQGNVKLARYLRGALPIDNLTGHVSWRSAAKQTKLRASDLTLTSGASQMTLTGSLTVPTTGAPVADLTTHINTTDCPALLAHVPQDPDMPFDELRPWLATAIKACDVTLDGFLSGPLDQMFAKDGKHLGITISGSDLTMEYKPGWPELTDAAGTIRLRGAQLGIDIDRGKILGVALDKADIKVANVREPVLFLNGAINSAPAPKLLSFLAESPLQERFGKLVKVLDVKGQAGLDLKLRLPLKDGLGDIKTHGVIHTRDDRINHAILPAPVTAVTGDIAFDNDGLSAQDLQGNLLGMALTSSITPAGNGRIDITSLGRIALPADNALLDHYLPRPWLALAHGSTQLKALLQIDMQGRISDLSLHSNLTGMALNLPQPLHKAADASRTFALKVKDGGDVAVSYGDAHVAMTFAGKNLQRAIVGLGQIAADDVPTGKGLWLGGQIDVLPVQAWLDTLQQLRAKPQPSAADKDKKDNTAHTLPFLGADLALGQLRFGKRDIDAVQLQVQPLKQNGGWQLAISGTDAQGQATWHSQAKARSRLQAHLAYLHINAPDTKNTQHNTSAASTDEPDSSTLTDMDPALLPAVDITIDDLRVGPTDFGTARISATALSEGWKLAQATLAGGALSVDSSGQWTRHVGLTKAQLNLHVHGQGLAQLARALGHAPPLQAQQVAIKGTLNITGNDHGIDLAALNGKLSILLKAGTITSIDPGASRLLGLLNIYALPRRLLLDFSDVVSDGLEFDKISGHFKLLNGDAFTDDLAIKTPAMDINIVGRIGLAARDYDQTVTVMPKLDTGLTVAGTVLGGPVAGAAVFALQKLLQSPLDKISSITYQTQGSWDNPTIVDPHAKD